MKPFTVASLFCLLFLISNCANQNEVKSPEQKLIDKINYRLENKDFVKSHLLTNRYRQISNDISSFRTFITSHPQLRAVHTSFIPIANSTVLGMQNPNDIQLIKSSLQEYYSQTGEAFSESDFYATNERLNRYTSDDVGVNNLFEDALKEKSLSPTQSVILKTLLSNIASAKSVNEANAVNKTIEYEVISSGITESDKALILTTNSVFNENLQRQIAKTSESEGNFYSFQKTAVVAVIFLVVVVRVAVAAVVGAITGSLFCCLIQDDCSWNCIAPRVRNSVLTTIGRAAYGLLFL